MSPKAKILLFLLVFNTILLVIQWTILPPGFFSGLAGETSGAGVMARLTSANPALVGLSLGFDYLFIVIYTLLSVSLLLVGGSESLMPRWVQWICLISIALAVVGALTDVAENIAIARAMTHPQPDSGEFIRLVQIPKLLLTVGPIVVGLIAVAMGRFLRGQDND